MATMRLQVAPWVFFPGAVLIMLVVAFGASSPEQAALWFNGTKLWIVEHLGWLFNASVSGFLVFVLAIAFTRYGHIRLGPDDSRPEFGYPTWFAMLFSAGMGIGLMFFSVAEPMYHLQAPPIGVGRTDAAARLALGVTFYHWGLHAWAVYVLLGLALAYFAFRKSLPLSVRSVLHPLLGERIHGRTGDLVDLLAVFGTVFGLATSLGLGARQINAGLTYLFDLPNTVGVQVTIISLVTCAATLSLVSGMNRGIRRLSELNVLLASVLLAFVFVLGPTGHILAKLPRDVLSYGKQIVGAFTFGDRMGSDEWQASWSVFYWAWWIAWAPFVGTFVARISRGRTIREFVLGVLLVPTLVTMVWLLVFGETAMFMQRHGEADIVAAVNENNAVAIYHVLEHLPAAHLMSGLAVVAVTLFFVTSSDSGSFVVDMLASGGHPDPPLWQRLFWALTEGAVAIVLLLAGGLGALQSAAIATGLPFCVVLLVTCVSLVRSLRTTGGAFEGIPQPAQPSGGPASAVAQDASAASEAAAASES